MKFNVFEVASIDRAKAIDLHIANLNAEKSALLEPIAAGLMRAILSVPPSSPPSFDEQINLLPPGEHRTKLMAAAIRHQFN